MSRQELGRKRLAMRLPQMRARIMIARNPSQLALFEAYELAVETRDRISMIPAEAERFEEYSSICIEIEHDIVRRLSEG